jgi:hypothetical protein
MLFLLLSDLSFSAPACPWMTLWKTKPNVELSGDVLKVGTNLEISLRTSMEQDRFYQELELCQASGDVVQSYSDWMQDNQPQFRKLRYAGLGVSGVSVGLGAAVWEANADIGKPAVVLGLATASFSAATFWIDRPSPNIETAFLESFTLFLERRHTSAMDWMDQLLSAEQVCFDHKAGARQALSEQSQHCEQAQFYIRNSDYPNMFGAYSGEEISSRIEQLKLETQELDQRERVERALYYCNASGRFSNSASAALALKDILWLVALPEENQPEIPGSCQKKIDIANRMIVKE